MCDVHDRLRRGSGESAVASAKAEAHRRPRRNSRQKTILRETPWSSIFRIVVKPLQTCVNEFVPSSSARACPPPSRPPPNQRPAQAAVRRRRTGERDVVATRFQLRGAPKPVLFFYPSTRATARPPETIHSQSEHPLPRYSLRARRWRRTLHEPVRAARVSAVPTPPLRFSLDGALWDDARPWRTAKARSAACAPAPRCRSCACVCPRQSVSRYHTR